MGENAVQAERSSAAIAPHESQDLVVPSPSPTHSSSSPTHSLSRLGGAEGAAVLAAAAGLPATPTTPGGSKDGQVNAITVLTLLDKLVNMLDTVQENQHKMELRQADMEGAVRGIQSDMTKLSKCHTSTSNTVSKLLEKSRKVSVHMKEVKDKMDKQAVQVKKLEANHAHLLKRNNFKVLIFQDENEIPASVFVKEPAPYPRDAEEEPPVSPPADANRAHEEPLQTINLSSDEELGLEEDDDEAGQDVCLERMEKSRAEKIKRSSLKKVDSLKKAFSRQNIEKKMNKIGTKIVSQEQREKIKKSLTPNHQKSPTAKSSSFKVSPLTFNVKKVRDGEGSAQPEAASDSATAAVGLAPLSSPEEDLPFTEVHTELAPALEEAKAVADSLEKEVEELASPSSSGLEADLSITEVENPEYALSDTLPQDPKLEEKEEEEEEKKEEKKEDEEEEKKEDEEKVAEEGKGAKESPTEEAPLEEAS
ncbi:hypothetical protein SKAU_G00256260 [Synaphobranchus kaupii]|uniref:Serum deprivation-response protein n=1 Tax=Synaphobranchus kaupii TaxID=118154 RepID=A0A9Q1IRG3_SYNKA|nr:hypothetical protein SKAU_G00256260 [Synaphobranchus kaupii]